MSNFISVNGAVNDLTELTKQLTGAQLNKAIARGLNATLKKGRTEARTTVKNEFNIPQKFVNAVDINKAFPGRLYGSIYAPTKPLPLAAFNPTFQTPTKSIRNTKKGEQRIKSRTRRNNNPNAGVTLSIKKGEKTTIPYAFMIPGAKPHVFARGNYQKGATMFKQRNKREKKTGTDTHVNPLMGVTIHQAIIKKEAIAQITKRVNSEAPKDMRHEIENLVRQIKTGVQ